CPTWTTTSSFRCRRRSPACANLSPCPEHRTQRAGPMTSTFVALIDLLGTFAFAISGGLVAVRHRLDLFGVLVLSFAAATAGGIIRDVLLDTVPVSVVDWRYLALSM